MNKRENKVKSVIPSVMLTSLLVCAIIAVLVCKAEITRLNDEIQVLQGEVVLEPCFICGEKVELKPVNDSFYIECDPYDDRKGCGLKTGYYDSKVQLIEEWNSATRE